MKTPPGQDVYYGSDWYHVEGALDRIIEAPKDRPLCIYIPLGYPHPPYAMEDPYYSQIDRAKIPKRIPTLRNRTGKPSLLQGKQEREPLRAFLAPDRLAADRRARAYQSGHDPDARVQVRAPAV